MSAIVPYVSFISQYIPAAVKDAAGLCPQISEAVRHITWLSVDRVFWPGAEVARFFLVLGYADGFQLWDLQDPGAAREVLSKKGNWGILQAKMLPAPMAPTTPSAAPSRQAAHGTIGLQHAPLLAYQRQGVPNVVRLFSLRSNDDVHLLRLTEPARSLQASRRYFAVGFARQAELYDALTLEALFSVQCSEGPSFVLGHRWLAYNLPPQQSAASSAGLAAGRGLLTGGARQLPTVMRDGVRYLGQVGQRTLDNMLMPLPEGADQPPAARAGVVVVRDVAARGVVAQFEDHSEPVDAMAWDPSGLQLITAGAQGHQVLVHRALLGMQQALVVQDAGGDGLTRGGVVFQHLYTLSRGVTPAVISDIAVSDNGQFVAVSSAKGTTHVFRLPPLHSAAVGHHCLAEQGAVRLAPAQPRTSSPAGEVGISLSMGGAAHRPATLSACTRVRLGSVLLQEGLMPKCGFPAPAPPSSSAPSRMFVATRAGTVQLYTLSPGGPAGGAGGTGAAAAAAAAAQGSGEGSFAPPARPHGCGEGGDWQAVLTRETQVWRQLAHFSERRLSPVELGGDAPARRGPEVSSPRASPRGVAPRQAPGSWQAASPRAAASGRSSARASPTLGPRPSPLLSPADRSPARQGAGPPARGPELGRPGAPDWAAEVETATHAPVEVPLWLCPQLSFHAHPAGARPGDLNAALRSGQAVGGRRRLVMRRPPRLGEGYDVQYRGRGVACGGGGEERLSDALGAAVSQAAASPRGGCETGAAPGAPPPLGEEPVEGLRPMAAGVTMAPAWGAVGYLGDMGSVEDAGGSLLQADGVGCGMEEVVEDWLTAS